MKVIRGWEKNLMSRIQFESENYETPSNYTKDKRVEVWYEGSKKWREVIYVRPGIAGMHIFKLSGNDWLLATDDKDMRPISKLDESNPNSTFKERRTTNDIHKR